MSDSGICLHQPDARPRMPHPAMQYQARLRPPYYVSQAGNVRSDVHVLESIGDDGGVWLPGRFAVAHDGHVRTPNSIMRHGCTGRHMSVQCTAAVYCKLSHHPWGSCQVLQHADVQLLACSHACPIPVSAQRTIGYTAPIMALFYWHLQPALVLLLLLLYAGLFRYQGLCLTQALAVAMAAFGYLYIKRRWTINPDSVYRIALRQLNTNPGVLEVSTVSCSDFL